jgi:DNA repair photolyase
MGCVQRCGFCSARAHPIHPGDDTVFLFADTAERLERELANLRRRPRAVFISPATDPFPPSLEIQAETVRVVEVLARHQVDAWLITRGYIRPFALRQLEACREHVRVNIGLTTLDRDLQRALEPLAAPPHLRLRQIERLRSVGIPVQVGLEPLIPSLTDTRTNLTKLLGALAQVGVQHVTTSYLFLRPGIQNNLVHALKAHSLDEAVLDAFEDGPLLKGKALAAARYLPRSVRQRGYAALMALAANFGITVSVCGLTNPDFQPARKAPGRQESRQRLLSFGG